MLRKVANAALLSVVCVILTACGPSDAERIAQVTAVAGSIFATQTAAAAAPTPTQAPAATSLPPTATATPPPPTATATPPPPTATPVPSIIGEMLPIPAGTSQLGCDPAHTEAGACRTDLPLFPVYLGAYRIDKTEVTNAQYAHCVAGGGCTEPATYSSTGRVSYYENPDYANYPVIWVDWHQAGAYCAWAGKRLPTAAEWEKAARGSIDTRPFPWGDDEPSCALANAGGCTGDTAAVGSYPGGASPYGALDMIGNVGEWVNDWAPSGYMHYDRQLFRDNPLGAVSGKTKMTLGGGWNTESWRLGVSGGEVSLSTDPQKGDRAPYLVFDSIGFRCAASPEEETGQPTPDAAGAALANLQVATATPTAQIAPPQPGTANAAGRVLWNDQGVGGAEVRLCAGFSPITGCSGNRYIAKTDHQGNYIFENVAPHDYSMLVHSIDDDSWFYFGPADTLFSAASITFTLTAGQTLAFEDAPIWKHDLQAASPTAEDQPDPEHTTLTWKAYPGAAYYGVYIDDQQMGEPIGERANGNSITVTGAPVCKYWRVEAYNAQGTKIAVSSYVDFRGIRPSGSCGEVVRPVATRAPRVSTAPAPPTAGPSASSAHQAGDRVPFEVVACPTQGVAITAITVARPGWWSVRGSAEIPDLEYWKGEVSADGNTWNMLYRSSTPVRDGVLIDFNTGTVPQGTYQVRLTAVDRTGNYPEPCIVQVTTR